MLVILIFLVLNNHLLVVLNHLFGALVPTNVRDPPHAIDASDEWQKNKWDDGSHPGRRPLRRVVEVFGNVFPEITEPLG